jgi:hypothetical protein
MQKASSVDCMRRLASIDQCSAWQGPLGGLREQMGQAGL